MARPDFGPRTVFAIKADQKPQLSALDRLAILAAAVGLRRAAGRRKKGYGGGR